MPDNQCGPVQINNLFILTSRIYSRVSILHTKQFKMAESNPNKRVENFCDGVFAIALTLLIIDIKIPFTLAINSAADFWQV
jgi:Endosomal/lysosomal potassium channel TMEM175